MSKITMTYQRDDEQAITFVLESTEDGGADATLDFDPPIKEDTDDPWGLMCAFIDATTRAGDITGTEG